MPPSGSHGPRHTQLGTPGRRQHYEYQEDKQYPDHNGEQAEQYEETGNDTPHLFGRVQQAALDVYYDELGQRNDQGVYLANQLIVAGLRHSFQELGPNVLV